MELQQLATNLVDSIGEGFTTLVGEGLGLNDVFSILESKHDNLNLDSMMQKKHRPIVKADEDADEDYEAEMAEM